MKNIKVFFCFILFASQAAIALADVTATDAKMKAIKFAKSDESRSYGGEISIEKATSIVKSAGELDILSMTARLICNTQKDEAPVCNLINEGEFELPDFHIAKIEYIDCARVLNFIGVHKKTGKVYYLFSLTNE